MTYVLLIIGFVLLIKGADIFVEGSASIAKALKVPAVIIGLTIVALGTSAPEAAVSITAGITGNNAIALSNVVGSNLFNLLVVLGACAVIKPLTVEKNIIKRDFPILLGVSVLLPILAINMVIGRIDGIILLVVFIGFIALMVGSALKNRVTEDDDSIKKRHPAISVLFILIGIAAIIFGGDLVVDSASAIAASFGLSQTLIGLTIVAVGTSLPELVTSIVASRKGQTDLAVGNVVGSNLFNIIFILGTSSTITPIPLASFGDIYDMLFVLAVTLMVFLFCFRSKKINRVQGILCVLLYAGYMTYAILRN